MPSRASKITISTCLAGAREAARRVLPVVLAGITCLSLISRAQAQAPVTISLNGNITGTGTMTLWVDSYSKSIRYGPFSSAASLAAGFGGVVSLDTNAPVWAKGYPDGTVKMNLRHGGHIGSVHIDVTPDGGGSIPIVVSTNPGDVGSGGPASGTPIYSYNIAAWDGSNGYDPAGNVVAFSDSVNAQWTASYDNLNRLSSAVQSSTTSQIPTPWGNAMQQFLCWQYDSFGNRLQQVSSSSAYPNAGNCTPPGGAAYNASALSVNGNNQVTNQNYTYDSSGNLISDGIYTYQYDGASRVCAVLKNVTGTMVGYLYDALGHRVAKGRLTPQTGNWCDLSTNGFVMTSHSVLGLDGQTLTEFDDTTASSHSDITLAGGVSATLTATSSSATKTHFQFTDWLGTRRVQSDALGTPEETCMNGVFGDALNCTGIEATNRHFTGKERDSESGLDYFGARYYGSSMGRWLSADWADRPEAVPYGDLENPQSLNLYDYVNNNPLSQADPDGHCCWDKTKQWVAEHPRTSQALGGLTKVAVGVGLVGTIAGGDVPGGVMGAGLVVSGTVSAVASVGSGTTDVVGAATKTNVEDAQKGLDSVSNVPALVTTAATGNPNVGAAVGTLSDAAQLATKPQEALKNPATMADAAKTVSGTVGLSSSAARTAASAIRGGAHPANSAPKKKEERPDTQGSIPDTANPH